MTMSTPFPFWDPSNIFCKMTAWELLNFLDSWPGAAGKWNILHWEFNTLYLIPNLRSSSYMDFINVII